jgi:hypothetical protein
MHTLNAVWYQYATNNVWALEALGGEGIAKLNYGMPKVWWLGNNNHKRFL